MLDRKLVGIMLLLFASCGCRTCTNCCDDLPPVLDGPYSHVKGRAGSAFTGASYELPQRHVDLEDPPTAENGEEPRSTTDLSTLPFAYRNDG